MKGDDRITNNFHSTNYMIPSSYGLRKDHKIFEGAIKGPPTRPVCGAVIASNWYKRGDHETVMFVEATPNGQLTKAYRKALKEAGLKIHVVERVGKSLKKMLTKSDPFRKGKCNQNKCKICKLDSSIICKGSGVVYQIKCQGCTRRSINDGLYVGETARSIGERVSEHLTKYEVKDKNSIFQKHIEEKHWG